MIQKEKKSFPLVKLSVSKLNFQKYKGNSFQQLYNNKTENAHTHKKSGTVIIPL